MKKYISIFLILLISEYFPLFAFANSQTNYSSVNTSLSGYTSLQNYDNKTQKKLDSSYKNSENHNLQSNNREKSIRNGKFSSSIKDKTKNQHMSFKSIETKYDNHIQFSPIEKLFNNNQTPKKDILKQFGYDLIGAQNTYNSSSKVNKDYKLNVGDKITVYFWGDSVDLLALSGSNLLKPVSNTSVNKNGNIFISGVGFVQAKEKTISDVEKQIKSILSGKFSNFKVKVSINKRGNVPVFVMGNVKQPGIVYLPSSSTILDALNAVGGITKNGSFRNIKYSSSNKCSKYIDLYDVLLNGNIPNISLKDGDIIVVNPIGKVVALSNGVKQPAIYEFKSGESLKTIINYAGGFLPSINLSNIQIESFDSAKNQKILAESNFASLNGFFVKDGDFIQFKELYNMPENIITLEGNIKSPGKIPFKEGMHLSDVIKFQNDLLPNTYLSQCLINRTKGKNKESVTIPVSLADFLKGSINPELKPMDVIKVFTSTKMSNVEISGNVNNPGFIPYKEGMTLKDVLSITNFNVFSNNIVAEITNPNDEFKNVKTIYLYELFRQKDDSLNLELNPNDKILFRKVSAKEVIKTVKITGNVKNPGFYSVYSGMKLREAIEIAGGLAPNAYLKGLSFYRPSLSESQKEAVNTSILKLQENISMKVNTMESISDINQKADLTRFIENQQNIINVLKEKITKDYGRISINITSNNLNDLKGYENLEIQNGDEIYIPSIPQHVSIMGEVYNQSAIAYNKDKNIKYYMDNVGGLTKQANKKDTYIIRANGSTSKVKNIEMEIPEPGDTIIVPRKITIPLNLVSMLKDFTQIAFNALNTIFILTKL